MAKYIVLNKEDEIITNDDYETIFKDKESVENAIESHMSDHAYDDPRVSDYTVYEISSSFKLKAPEGLRYNWGVEK